MWRERKAGRRSAPGLGPYTPKEKDVKRTWREKPAVQWPRNRFALASETCLFAGPSMYGETQIRTGDTTIFSRVLYQLSYLAGAPDASACTALWPQSARRCGPLAPLEFLDERLVGHPQPLGEWHLRAPAELARGEAYVEAAVGELAWAQVCELRLDLLAGGGA